MKKVFLLAATFIITIGLAIGLTGCDNGEDAKKGEDAKNSESNSFIVGTEAAYAPFEYINDDGGNVIGVDMDIAQAIADKLGKELVIKNMDFDVALESVGSGKVDMVAAAVTITEDRKKVMDFSIPYFDSAQIAVVNAENPAIEETNIENLKGKIIGVQQGSVADTWCTENIKDAKEIRKYASMTVAAIDLGQDKIDLIILDKLVAEQMVEKSQTKLTIADGVASEGEQFALAIPKGNEDLVKVANEVITELKANGKIEEFLQNHNQEEK